MDAEYYLERERTELRMADKAACREARFIHLELARRYRALAASCEEQEQLQARGEPEAQAANG